MQERRNIIQRLLGKTVQVIVDRPLGYVHHGTPYPINYGYIPGVMAADGEEQDAYILGVHEPISHFEGRVIGAVCRKNDVEDKLIVAPEGMRFHQGEIAQAVRFQEQYFSSSILSLFHKSCGVLAWRENEGQKEFLIVFEQFSQCWSLPKGHMEAGETEAETALRELFEETSLRARLDIRYSASIEYDISAIAKKQVVFFPGQVSGIPKARAGEIERFKWVTQQQLPQYLFPDTVRAWMELIAHL